MKNTMNKKIIKNNQQTLSLNTINYLTIQALTENLLGNDFLRILNNKIKIKMKNNFNLFQNFTFKLVSVLVINYLTTNIVSLLPKQLQK
jgi:hypothetical protein